MSERFFLDVIDDGDWHRLSDVAEELNLPLDRIAECTRYLAKGRFIHYDAQRALRLRIKHAGAVLEPVRNHGEAPLLPP